MEKENHESSVLFLVCLIALVLPLVLIPMGRVVSHFFIIEEIVKAILILQILKFSSRKNQLKITLMMLFLFAFSENMFYLTNFITDGILYSFWQRFILTTTLHALTGLIIFLPSRQNQQLVFPATFLAMFVHFLYNQVVYSLIV